MKKRIIFILITCLCISSLIACGKKEKQTVSDNIANMTNEIQGMDEIDAKLEEQKSSAQFLTDEENGEETSSDNSASDASAIPGDMDDSEKENQKAEMEEYFSNISNNSGLTISNLSGLDLKEVYVSFSSCGINNLEVTQGKKLKDGNKLTYTFADMQPIRDAENVILSIDAVNKKGENVDFGDIKIIDVSNMNVILTSVDDGYKMYIK